MEVFNAIVEYLESRNLFQSAKKLLGLVKNVSFENEMTPEEQELVQLIYSSMKRPAKKGGAPPESEEIMESLMTKLISANKAACSKAVESNLDQLFVIKPFQKMISCADQLFLDNESMNISSRIVGASDDESLHSSFMEPSVKDSFEAKEYSQVDISQLDEYEDDEDAGFELYECREEDVHDVSKQLAVKYDFPNRASYPKKSEAKREPDDQSITFPSHIRFPDNEDKFYPCEFDGIVYDCYALKVITDRERTGFEEQKEFPVVMDSIIAGRYKIIEYLGSAAFSKAIQCLDTFTDEMVCLKIIENNKDYVDQSIDEIKLLLYTNINGDPDENNIIKVIDFFYHKEHLIIVTELLRDNLYEFYKYNRDHEEEFYFTMGRLQRISYQLLHGLKYLHSLKLIHCDLKPENILIKSYSRCLVKIIDLGSSCYIHDHLSSYVQSRSYRAPEVIIGCKYDYRIDIWSLGCILAELYSGNVLFQNDSIQGLLARVVSIMGAFPEYMFKEGRHVHNYFTRERLIYQIVDGKNPDSSDDAAGKGRRVQLFVPKRTSLSARIKCEDKNFVEFVGFLLTLDKEKRPTAEEALQHPWITQTKYPDGL